MTKKDLLTKLLTNKNKLQMHKDKWLSLRDQGKHKESLEELKLAIDYANKTNLLLQQIQEETPEKRERPKDRLLNIHVPVKKTIH